MAMAVRIQKILADSGLCSRRTAEKWIEEGRVTVNGRPCSVGDKAIPGKDLLAVDGEKVLVERKKTYCYVMLHKPRGYVTSMKDELERRDVSQLVADVPARVFPVGRLDRNSEGLLLFTNDGQMANRLMHPSYEIPKLYRVTVSSAVTEEQIISLAGGVMLEDGMTREATVRVLENTEGRSVLEIVIHEGKNRQVRRMCEAVGLQVQRLKRSAEGPLRLGMLPPGKWRYLTNEEVAALQRLTVPKNNTSKKDAPKKSVPKKVVAKPSGGRRK